MDFQLLLFRDYFYNVLIDYKFFYNYFLFFILFLWVEIKVCLKNIFQLLNVDPKSWRKGSLRSLRTARGRLAPRLLEYFVLDKQYGLMRCLEDFCQISFLVLVKRKLRLCFRNKIV